MAFYFKVWFDMIFYSFFIKNKEMLSVVTETKREESLNEVVSSTPLPDSPSPASEDKPGSHVPADDGFIEAMSSKKKSAATKKAELNMKGKEQDVVDLRANNWQKRREDAGPKTIEEIHAQAKKEQLSEKLKMYNTGPPPSMPRRDDPRKRSQKSSSSNQEEGGWQVLTRAAKNTLDKFDTTRVRNMVNHKVDIDSFQLGPSTGRGGGGFGTWGKGSAGPKSSRQEDTTMQNNRFASLSSDSNPAYEGRTSGGFSSSRPGSRPGSYVGRGSRGQSVDNDKAGRGGGGGICRTQVTQEQYIKL